MSYNVDAIYDRSLKEPRQHIKLSSHAYNILEADTAEFMPNEYFKKKRGPVSVSSQNTLFNGCNTIINHILRFFPPYSEASISIASENERKRVEELMLAGKGLTEGSSKKQHFLPPEFKSAIDMYIRAYQTSLANKYTSLIKDNTLTFSSDEPITIKARLQNDILDQFPVAWCDHPESKYYTKQCYYIKALLEDYATKSHAEREKIIFHEAYSVIENAIVEQKRLKIVYASANAPKNQDNGKHIDRYLARQKTTYEFKPYKILPGSSGSFCYVVGMSRLLINKQAPFKPVSMRISRIESVDVKGSTYLSGKITKEEKKQIEDEIHNKSVEYLTDKQQDFYVTLSPNGKVKFRRISHLRPEPSEKIIMDDQPQRVRFFSTESQIRNYFMSFGMDAIVEEPIWLAKELYRNYTQASENYKEHIENHK